MHAFPVGAWIVDPQFMRITNGGLVHNGRGGISFKPFAGEVVALLGPKPFPAYKIVFGGSENVIESEGAQCRHCQALDDNSHVEGCPVAPEGIMRVTIHSPGFAPEII